MIKIIDFSGDYCKVLFEVEPIRHSQIVERRLGEAIAKNSPNHLITENGDIYKSVDCVAIKQPIEKLMIMQREAQEEFSLRIFKLKKRVDDFKLIQELAKKEPVKKGE